MVSPSNPRDCTIKTHIHPHLAIPTEGGRDESTPGTSGIDSSSSVGFYSILVALMSAVPPEQVYSPSVQVHSSSPSIKVFDLIVII